MGKTLDNSCNGSEVCSSSQGTSQASSVAGVFSFTDRHSFHNVIDADEDSYPAANKLFRVFLAPVAPVAPDSRHGDSSSQERSSSLSDFEISSRDSSSDLDSDDQSLESCGSVSGDSESEEGSDALLSHEVGRNVIGAASGQPSSNSNSSDGSTVVISSMGSSGED